MDIGSRRRRVGSLGANRVIAVVAAMIAVCVCVQGTWAKHSNVSFADNDADGPISVDKTEPPFMDPTSKVELKLTETHHALVPVYMGETRQKQYLIMDSGSADVMVFLQTHCAKSSFQHPNCFNVTRDPLKPTIKRVLTLILDGITARSYCEEATTRVQISTRWMEHLACFGLDEQSSGYWNDTDGTLGLGYPSIAFGGKAFLPTVLQHNGSRPMFAFYLDQEARNGSLELGGNSWAVEWSETQTVPVPFYHVFPIFHLSMCSVNLFSNYSSHWNALLDTGSRALSLPGQFFDMVVAWMPHKCSAQGSTDMLTCHMSPLDVESLPSLYFRMSEQGRSLEVPMSRLLMSAKRSDSDLVEVEHVFAVRRLSTEGPASAYSLIIIGVQALESLYTAVDFRSRRVGMSQSPVFKPPTQRGRCPGKPSCVGAQQWYGPLNVCEDPDCSPFFFQTLDPVQRVCVVSTGSIVALVVLVVVFSLVEVWLQEQAQKTAYAARRADRMVREGRGR